MGNSFTGKITQLYERRVDGLSLAFFRVAYSLVLLLEVKQIFLFRTLIFSETTTPISLITGLLVLWALGLIGLLLGWHTRLSALINYAVGVFMVWHMPAFKYHFDFVMTTVNFLLLFLPVATVFSVDRYGQDKRSPHHPRPHQVSSLYVWLLVVMGLGLVYLDSAVNKLDSPMWRAGLGFWLPSSLPQNARINLSWWLNQPYLVQFIGYGILIFEGVFLLLVWFKPLRWVLVLTGFLLHLGIALAYPIPHFALLMLTLYIPLLPQTFWQKVRGLFGHLPLNHKPVTSATTLTHQRYVRQLLGGVLIYAILGQIMCMLAAPVVQNFAANIALKNMLATTQNLLKPIYFINQKFLGIVSHDIFLDKHFAQYSRLVAMSYVDENGKKIPLPLFTLTGQPSAYNTGRLWTKWTYRVTGAHPDKQNLVAGLKQFSRFWAKQQKISLKKAVFLIRVKPIDRAQQWEKNYLNKQTKQPWKTAGWLSWQEGQGRVIWYSKEN